MGLRRAVMPTVAAPGATELRRPSLSTEHITLLVLCAVLVLSGVAGLIYQVVWVRLLSLAFGVTIFSISTVLAAFMGGLAIGSTVGGRYADRLSRPLVAYAVVEIGIALVALTTPAILSWLQMLYRELAVVPPIAGLARGVLAFAILLVPTALMGASLPLAVRGVRRTGAEVRRDSRAMGALYALNTAGAIAGTLLAGFVLIGSYGIGQTVLLAALLNVSAGLTVLGLVALTRHRLDAVDLELSASSDAPPALARAAFWAFGVSGAISLAYEVVWSRVLAILFDSTIYGFVLMLATVLGGIAAGSALAGALVPRVPRARLVGLAFGWIELGIGAAAVLSLATFGIALDIVRNFGTTELGAGLLRDDIRVMAGLCIVTVLPAALLMGASFPVAARLWAAGAGSLGARLGGVYGINVAGGIIGSLVAGFVLVPLVGAHAALLTLAAGNVALGAGLVWVASDGRRSLHTVVPAVGGALLLGWGALQPPVHAQVFQARYPDQMLLWYREGLENTVSVARGASGVRTLFTNSRGQSNDEHDLVSFYRTIGHLPALLAPRPTRALVVGMGSGVTSSAIAEHPGSHVRIIELSDGMIAAAPQFRTTNRDLMHLPNVTITMDDGRNFLLRERGKYDLIAADVVHPYDAGSNNLYAVAYFRLVAQALSPNGVVLQWVSPVSEFEHKLIIRTFLAAFPHVTLWGGGDLLIGSLNPMVIERAELEQRLADPALRPTLQELNLSTVDEVLERFYGDTDELKAYVGAGPILNDEQPLFEYFYPRRSPTGPANTEGFSRDRNKVLAQP